MNAPSGNYPGDGLWAHTNKVRFRATGEYRRPKAGEYYLSGAIIAAYKALNDLDTPYWIAEPIKLIRCPRCQGTGKVELK